MTTAPPAGTWALPGKALAFAAADPVWHRRSVLGVLSERSASTFLRGDAATGGG